MVYQRYQYSSSPRVNGPERRRDLIAVAKRSAKRPCIEDDTVLQLIQGKRFVESTVSDHHILNEHYGPASAYRVLFRE